MRFADRVIRIDDGERWDLHLEIQADYDAGLPTRLLEYNVFIDSDNGFAWPVRSVVILLRPEADGRTITGRVTRVGFDGARYIEFAYQVVRLWTIPATALLAGPLAVVPLTPLADLTGWSMPAVVEAMRQRIETEAPTQEAERLWLATYILLGLRDDSDAITRLLEGVFDMRGSSTLNALLERGRTQGLAEGLDRGRAEGLDRGRVEGETQALRRVVLMLGTKRFGEPEPAARARIEAISDVATLNHLVGQIASTTDWAQLLTATT